MSDGLDRRAALAGLSGGLLLLTGCGFRPLYAPEREGDAPVNADLAAIRVGPVPDRSGQILRQELERRFQARGTAEARYTLTVTLLPSAELQGFRRDGSPSRVRWTYNAPFTLSTMAVPPVPIVTGSASAFDAYNIPDQQFFAGIQSSNAMTRRLVQELARDITERLAIALRDRPRG